MGVVRLVIFYEPWKTGFVSDGVPISRRIDVPSYFIDGLTSKNTKWIELISRLYKQYIVKKSFELLLLWKSRNTSVTARLDW